jgi:general stress protein YciG
MSKYKISYDGWSDEASPIKSDVKIKVSHNKLVSQKQNALARGEWGRKNPDKSHEIAKKGGEANTTDESRKRCSKVGTKYGKENAVKYIPIQTKQKNGKKFGKLNLVTEIICEVCGKTVNKGNYAQSHGKKCRELDKIKLIELLPSKFTKTITKDIAKEHGIKNWEKLNIFHHTCPYTKCIIKVEKPNQYNPCWYGKNIKEINKVKKSIK